ncbi:regulatory protein RecX [Cryobacterium sp. CG_9.6]|uniref:regulatory protein RecX n=1 Tax=Cryobacterium sp. CG_9.6 TaxID=2760710 RepID=UPI002473218B|nr:regulatory protein RecX [Cryobacterium sp. CG_9.6]MDH6236617.1 regulatory protein [Cryobacterium sp. CG_9.6]
MVHFEPADEAATSDTEAVAPVTYLPGAAPGMKRRSPLDSRTSGGEPREKTVFERTSPAPVDIGSTREEPNPWAAPNQRDAASDDFEADSVADSAEPTAEEAQASEQAALAEMLEHAEAMLLHRLRARSLSLVEAFSALKETDLNDGEAHDLIARFVELGYLDDVKLADQIIHTHHERKGQGRAGVETEMRRRKLDPSVMLDKLEELPDDEQERANEEAIKRIQQLSRFDNQTIDRRLTAFLQRKGYNFGVVREAVKAAMDSRGGGSSGVRFR